jgi:hypothetical protein
MFAARRRTGYQSNFEPACALRPYLARGFEPLLACLGQVQLLLRPPVGTGSSLISRCRSGSWMARPSVVRSITMSSVSTGQTGLFVNATYEADLSQAARDD